MSTMNASRRAVSLPAAVACATLWLLAIPASGQVDSAIDQAEAWLVSQQNGDGSIGSIPELVPRDSAAAVLALAGRPASEPTVTQGADYLEGVGEANAHFRSRRVLALARTGRSADSLLATLGDFRNGGGMGGFAVHQSNLVDTAFAVQALTLDETTYLLEIAALLDYLQLHQGADGGWGFSAQDPSEAYYSAEVLQAFAELEELAVGQEVLDGVGGYLFARQQADGSFGDLVTTALAYRALLAVGWSPADLPFGSPVPYLLAHQQADRSYRSLGGVSPPPRWCGSWNGLRVWTISEFPG
ncbi:MAG: hypothetical protein GY708_17795 [Actinomycetia bacterium]|nr:hypothetical protein [Actinomycetes bacterium]